MLENRKVLDNNDVSMLMLYLHYSAFKKVGAEHPEIQPLTKKIARALENAIDYKMNQLLENGMVFWDVYFIDTIEGKRPLDIKNTKFKFYVDEILSAVAVTNAIGEEVHIVSDNIYTVRVYGKFAKRFSAFVKMMLEHRTSSLNTNLKLKIKRDSLILVPHEAYIPVVKKMLVKSKEVRVVFYAPSESAKDMWPELAGFSERIANFLTNP
ncbi:hypothetical protein A3L04_08470 [Thermococcus chitonophagus]|uniref:Uncharacterized protein n=1 Tax=Thermococcus chitonophagus TaxID=54262 RepID=A0A170SJC2_9EURY|nr:hypothetical protein A3L04_08470 [Thermococcus chitonophagus]CUX77704.1 hypothetical protein CHITON_0925 [Thermococcus chitonophagus]